VTSSTLTIQLVGPEGYIHGWICVRPPCGEEGGHVWHPEHGRGRVLAEKKVRFANGVTGTLGDRGQSLALSQLVNPTIAKILRSKRRSEGAYLSYIRSVTGGGADPTGKTTGRGGRFIDGHTWAQAAWAEIMDRNPVFTHNRIATKPEKVKTSPWRNGKESAWLYLENRSLDRIAGGSSRQMLADLKRRGIEPPELPAKEEATAPKAQEWHFYGNPGETLHSELLRMRQEARANLPPGHPERLKAERAVRESRKIASGKGKTFQVSSFGDDPSDPRGKYRELSLEVRFQPRSYGGYEVQRADNGRSLGWVIKREKYEKYPGKWEAHISSGAFRGTGPDDKGDPLDSVPESYDYRGAAMNELSSTREGAAEVIYSHLVQKRAPAVGYGERYGVTKYPSFERQQKQDAVEYEASARKYISYEDGQANFDRAGRRAGKLYDPADPMSAGSYWKYVYDLLRDRYVHNEEITGGDSPEEEAAKARLAKEIDAIYKAQSYFEGHDPNYDPWREDTERPLYSALESAIGNADDTASEWARGETDYKVEPEDAAWAGLVIGAFNDGHPEGYGEIDHPMTIYQAAKAWDKLREEGEPQPDPEKDASINSVYMDWRRHLQQNPEDVVTDVHHDALVNTARQKESTIGDVSRAMHRHELRKRDKQSTNAVPKGVRDLSTEDAFVALASGKQPASAFSDDQLRAMYQHSLHYDKNKEARAIATELNARGLLSQREQREWGFLREEGGEDLPPQWAPIVQGPGAVGSKPLMHQLPSGELVPLGDPRALLPYPDVKLPPDDHGKWLSRLLPHLDEAHRVQFHQLARHALIAVRHPVVTSETAVAAAKYLWSVREALPQWYTWALRTAFVATSMPGVPDGGLDETLYTIILGALLLRHRPLLRTVWHAGAMDVADKHNAKDSEQRARALVERISRTGPVRRIQPEESNADEAPQVSHQELLRQRTLARQQYPAGHPERLKAERAVRQSRKQRRATMAPVPTPAQRTGGVRTVGTAKPRMPKPTFFNSERYGFQPNAATKAGITAEIDRERENQYTIVPEVVGGTDIKVTPRPRLVGRRSRSGRPPMGTYKSYPSGYGFTGTMQLRPDIFDTLSLAEDTQRVLKSAVEQRWWPLVDWREVTLAQMILAHEFGHGVAGYIGTPYDVDFWRGLADALGTDMPGTGYYGNMVTYEDIRQWLKRHRMFIGSRTSTYAVRGAKLSEFLAELWAEYTLSKQPRAAAKYWGDYVMTQLEKRRSRAA
jgi:hypothetical protein